jgi:AbrB family looped-hinge helix DNA binding protein
MSKVSTKGQVTIPIAYRELLGLFPGTDVKFELDGDGVRLSRDDSRSRGEALVARLRERGAAAWTSGMTTDEILALTRGE